MKFIFMVFVLLFLFSMNFVSAVVSVGVSPANVNFKQVLRGGYAERYTTLTVDSDEIINVEFEPRGDISDWIGFPKQVNISGSPERILITVEPPSYTPNGNYTGFLRVYTSALGSVDDGEGKATGFVRAVVDIAISVEVTDTEILSCGANGFSVNSVEQGDDLVVDFNFINSGNIRLRPQATIDIWDQGQIEIVKSVDLTGEDVLPTKQGEVEFRISSDDLDLGQYWMDVNVPDCFSSDTLTFDVLAQGALRSKGTLLRIEAPFAAETGETLPITAFFQNVGEKEVNAKFEGKITRDGKIIQLLESDEQRVSINEITTIPFFFTPEETGTYIASGRVLYDKKKTFESSVTMIIAQKIIGWKEILTALAYIILMIVIGVLFFKIRSEKRKYKQKLRGFR